MELLLIKTGESLHLLSQSSMDGFAQAYMGPGAGLGMIGTLIAVGIAVLVIVLGLVIYPIRLFMKNMKQKPKPEEERVSGDGPQTL